MPVDYAEIAGPPAALPAAAEVAAAAAAAAAAGSVDFAGSVWTVGLAPLPSLACSSPLSSESWPGATAPDPQLLAASRPKHLTRQQSPHLCRPGVRWTAAVLGLHQHYPLKQRLNPEAAQPSQVPAGQAELGMQQEEYSEMVGAAKGQNSHHWQEVHSPDLEPHRAEKGLPLWRCPWGSQSSQRRALAWSCDLEVASEAELTTQWSLF